MFSTIDIQPRPYFLLPLTAGFPVANTRLEDIAEYLEQIKQEALEIRKQQEAEDEEWLRKAMIPSRIF
jgi:hypothetical protein